MGFETQDVERKIISILKVLSDSKTSLGSRLIARRLKDCGIQLSERAVRYHLKLMDERGLTQLVGRRDGRVLTERGVEEIDSALVKDKVGLAISRIEILAFRTDFDLDKRTGSVPINVSFFSKARFGKALKAMETAFAAGLGVSRRVAVAQEGEMLGEILTPPDTVGLATVCSVVINGALLKAGVPMNSKFGGILQIKNHKPLRFVELIQYSASSLDPSEIYIASKMTSVGQVARKGEGRILANFREIPAICQPTAEKVVAGLKEANLGGLLMMGEVSKSLCEIPVELNKVGMILIGGLNPVAAAVESGIEVANHAMSTVIEYKNLIDFQELMS